MHTCSKVWVNKILKKSLMFTKSALFVQKCCKLWKFTWFKIVIILILLNVIYSCDGKPEIFRRDYFGLQSVMILKKSFFYADLVLNIFFFLCFNISLN